MGRNEQNRQWNIECGSEPVVKKLRFSASAANGPRENIQETMMKMCARLNLLNFGSVASRVPSSVSLLRLGHRGTWAAVAIEGRRRYVSMCNDSQPDY